MDIMERLEARRLARMYYFEFTLPRRVEGSFEAKMAAIGRRLAGAEPRLRDELAPITGVGQRPILRFGR
jgi:hypothetical protein